MKNRKFIVLNIIATFIEISLILLFIISSIKDNPILGIVCLAMYVIFLGVTFSISLYKKSIFDDLEMPDDIKNKIDSIYNKFKKHFPEISVEFLYVKDKHFIEPAAYLDGKIYINSEYKFSDVFLDGIIGHELGHAQSRLVKYKTINLLRVSSIFARQIYTFRFKNRHIFNKSLFKIIDILLLIIYNIFNIFDHIVSNPFFRKDEIYANSIAVKIGCGESLRYFYYNSLLNTDEEIKYIRNYYDYKHPSTEKMLRLVEADLNLDESEEDVIAVNNIIRKIKNSSTIDDRNNKIMKWYHFKSTQGIDVIYYELAMIYSRGKFNCEIDNEKARNYLLSAKELGYTPAVYQLAVTDYENNYYDSAYLGFKYLVEKNVKKAYVYYANCLAYGLGVDKNPDEAYEFYKLASEVKNITGRIYISIMNKTFIYASHSNKEIDVEKDIYKFNSVDEVLRIDELGNEYKYSISFTKSLFTLIDKDNNEFGKFSVRGKSIVRKSVFIEKDEVTYPTSITYNEETSNNEMQEKTL